MAEVAEAVLHVLEPYLGRTVADTCVRATALSIGKSSDALTLHDLPVLESSIRRVLAPIASSSTIESIISKIEEEAA